MTWEKIEKAFDELNSSEPDFFAAEELLVSSLEENFNQGVFFLGVLSIRNGSSNFEKSVEYFYKKDSCLEYYLKYLKSDKSEYRYLEMAAKKGHLVSRYYLTRDSFRSSFFKKPYLYIKLVLMKIDLYINSKTRQDRYLHEFDYI